jgi:hypothetical protein
MHIILCVLYECKTFYSLTVIYASTSHVGGHVGGVGSMRSWKAMQNKFEGKLPNSVLWKSAGYYSIESSLLKGS